MLAIPTDLPATLGGGTTAFAAAAGKSCIVVRPHPKGAAKKGRAKPAVELPLGSFTARRVAVVFAEQITTRFIEPSLRSASVKAYEEFINAIWVDYLDALSGCRAALSSASAEQLRSWSELSRQSVIDDIVRDLPPIAGTGAAEEVEFAEHTFRRALRLVERFVQMPKPVDISKDREHAATFANAAAMYAFQLSTLIVITMCKHKLAAGVLDVIMAYLRASALWAHSSAKEGLRLREAAPADPTQEQFLMGHFDDEDHRLADSSAVDAASALKATGR